MSESTFPLCSSLDLLDGIAVFIDDEANTEHTDANNLKKQIEEKNIPLIVRTEIPDSIDDFVKHLYGISFIILDWKFLSSPNEYEQVADGVHIPERIGTGATIDFLEKLLTVTYCPIFIISQESITSIENELNKRMITKAGRHPRIFIHGKNELSDGQLFLKLNDWVGKRPITYVLKTWEMAARKAKFGMFANLEDKHVCWPQVLWKTFGDDHINQSDTLSATLCNIFSNHLIANTFFESEKIKSGDEICPADIRSVLEAERFIQVTDTMPPSPGDIFKQDNSDYYLLNIRAQCDLLHIPEPELYCIRGSIINESKILTSTAANLKCDDKILFFMHQFHGHENTTYIPFVLGNKILEFDFKYLRVKKFDSKFKQNRIGRLLPPFITKIQQLFSAYMVREGLPAIPDEAIGIDSTTGTVVETGKL